MDDELGISVFISRNTIISGGFQQDFLPEGVGYIEDAGAAYFYTTDPDDPGDIICPPVFYTQETSICAGDTFDVGESSYDASGFYEDVIIMDDRCDSTIFTFLTVIEPVTTSQEFSLCFGESIVVGEIMCEPFVEIADANDQTYETEANGYYALIVKEDGCSDTSDCYLIYTIGIEEMRDMINEISVYPNPSQEIITINVIGKKKGN